MNIEDAQKRKEIMIKLKKLGLSSSKIGWAFSLSRGYVWEIINHKIRTRKYKNNGIAISLKEVGYYTIHNWLSHNFGKASKCENPSCLKKSSYFSYALLKGKRHKRDRKNYIQLCRQCHFYYDGIKGWN